MSDYDEALAILKRMEQNQTRSIEMQVEQLALVKDQMARTEATVQQSIALQKQAVAKQTKALNLVLPILLGALLYVAYLIFRHA